MYDSYSVPLDFKMTHIMTVLLVPAMDPMSNMDAAHHKLAELMVAPCAQFIFWTKDDISQTQGICDALYRLIGCYTAARASHFLSLICSAKLNRPSFSTLCKPAVALSRCCRSTGLWWEQEVFDPDNEETERGLHQLNARSSRSVHFCMRSLTGLFFITCFIGPFSELSRNWYKK